MGSSERAGNESPASNPSACGEGEPLPSGGARSAGPRQPDETATGSDNTLVALTDEHRMLLRMRATLYEGSWEDFISDLLARAQDKPHVFETVPTSPEMKSTIAHHLKLIGQMQAWEDRHGRTLGPDDALATAQ